MKSKTLYTDHLSDTEAREVLAALLKRHPELADEAQIIAKATLEDISVNSVVDEVDGALQAVDDIDNLNARAGSTSYGYVEPSDAAIEICEEAIEPFMQDMERRLEAGDLKGALVLCQGIVWGLYKVRKISSGGVIEWAGEDCLCEEAGSAIEKFVGQCRKKGLANKTPIFPEGFLKENTPEWASWIQTTLARLDKVGNP
ncbi:MAG: hypothetical protein HY547_05100 [Elusimicrobia bacterium]|nr:hypothetical protein [Elusimicrobiota bacterium]